MALAEKKQTSIAKESGQSLVEFALLLPILMLLLLIPVDLYRYANAKMILKSAASEGISQLTYADVSTGDTANALRQTVEDYYGDKLDTGRVTISLLNESPPFAENYTYYVYSSEKAIENPTNFWNQFESRNSSYKCMEVQVQMTYTLKPVTFWGSLLLGSSFDVVTPVYSRDVYVTGYMP